MGKAPLLEVDVVTAGMMLLEEKAYMRDATVQALRTTKMRDADVERFKAGSVGLK